MKKAILLLAMAMSFTFFAHAQKNYTSSIVLMLEYANNDFKDILGVKGSDVPDLESASYTPKEIIGIGSESIIKSNNSDASFYLCSVPLLDAAKLIKDVLDLANSYVKEGKFTGEDFSDDKGKSVTEIKNKEGFDVMKIVSQYTDDNNADNDYFLIAIYGKAMQAKMKQ